ncbi:MAG: 30S ribosomal protein S4, partial [Sphingomonas sp.]|nr:30S ribosomal protein S4 [Sphingomonas sp.]
GQRRKGKMSDFGLQLRAKQKLKGYYGDVTEKQFRRAYDEASRMKGDTSQNLIGLLEQRLDIIVYRAKFAPTVWSARQLVSHGHVYVNGTKCNIASRRVLPGDVVSLGSKAQEMALVMEAQSLAERDIPDYVVPDGAAKVTFSRVPQLDEVPYPVKMEPNLVVEFYSR